MAITLDQNLGSTASTSGATARSHTTTAAAASGSTIYAMVSWWNETAGMSVSGGGLTWSSVVQSNNPNVNSGGNDRFAIFKADAPSGLANSTSITFTKDTINGGILFGAVSYLGIGTLDITATNSTSGTSWSSGSATNSNDGALVLGGAGNETASSTSTPVNGTELFDKWASGDGQGFAGNYSIVSGTASQSVSGTWSVTSAFTTGALAIYNPAAAAAQIIEAARDFALATFGPF